MAANVTTTLLGIWLVYAAVLDPPLTAGPFKFVATLTGAAIVILACLARRTDYHPWHSSVTAFLGAALFLAGCWNAVAPAAVIVNYWTMFWIGVLAAFVALWAAIYRPEAGGA